MSEMKPYHRNERMLSESPFRELESLERRFFGDTFDGFFGGGDIAGFKTDISDLGDSYLLEADLPGFEKKDICLDVSGDTLTISAERRSEHKEKNENGNGNYIRLERSYGRYKRRFDVSAVDVGGIKAKYDNGVLKMTLPKKEATAPKSISVEIE